MTQIRQQFQSLPFRRELCGSLTGALLLGSVLGALCAKCFDPAVIRQFGLFSAQSLCAVPVIRRLLRAALLPSFLSLLLVSRKRNGFFPLFFLKGFLMTVVLCGLLTAEPGGWRCLAAILVENALSLPMLLFTAAVWREETTGQCPHLFLLSFVSFFSFFGALLAGMIVS